MLTIQNAAPTRTADGTDPIAQGRVTWLKPLDAGGKPLIADVACPLARIPTTLEGKDWTRYEGLLHTDHAVREEFFVDRDTAPTASKPYLMDFTYLYDQQQPDFEEFSRGERFTDEAVYADIGDPAEWTYRTTSATVNRSEEQAARVAEQLLACNRWETLPGYAHKFDEGT